MSIGALFEVPASSLTTCVYETSLLWAVIELKVIKRLISADTGLLD